jgi:hypothetical protein
VSEHLPAPGRYRRKRPTEVEAIQWTGCNFADVKAFGSGAVGIGPVEGGALPLWVVKSSATCRVERGDWIIRERDGSGFYPCNADVFAAIYEPAGGTGTGDHDQLVIAEHAIGEVILAAMSAQAQGSGVDPAILLDLLAAWTGIPALQRDRLQRADAIARVKCGLRLAAVLDPSDRECLRAAWDAVTVLEAGGEPGPARDGSKEGADRG